MKIFTIKTMVTALAMTGCLLSSQLLAGALNVQGAGTINGDLDVVNHRIKNVAEPTADQDGATKGYVDDQVGVLTDKLALNPNRVALLRWYKANRANRIYDTGLLPQGIAFDGKNMWITSFAANSLTVMQASDFDQIGPYGMPDSCGPDYIVYDGRNMWVSCSYTGNLHIFRARNGSHAFTLTKYGSNDMAFDGKHMWIGDSTDGSIWVIDVDTRGQAVEERIPGALNTKNASMAFDGEYMWAAFEDFDKILIQSTPPNMTLSGTVPITGGASDIAFDGTNMWIASASANTVTVLGPVEDRLGPPPNFDPTVGASILAELDVGYLPNNLVFDGTNMWVVSASSDNATLFRTSDFSKEDTVDLGDNPVAGAFDGANVWIVNYDDGTVGKY